MGAVPISWATPDAQIPISCGRVARIPVSATVVLTAPPSSTSNWLPPSGSPHLQTVSEPIITELAHTLEDPYFRQRRTTEQIAADIALLREKAVITAITVEVDGVATHPEDDLVLATVVPAQADYLVTGDTKLQRLGSYQRVTIVSPRQFLNILTTQAPPEEETE